MKKINELEKLLEEFEKCQCCFCIADIVRDARKLIEEIKDEQDG